MDSEALEPDPVMWFQERKMFPVFIEQGGTDIDSYDFRQLFRVGDDALIPCLVVGSECDGLPQELIDLFPNAPRLTIGQPGLVRSFNVACAGSMAMERLYYAYRRSVMDRYGLDA
jgi:tRNA G18 (ribose-2'-O)-methylase SpoU